MRRGRGGLGRARPARERDFAWAPGTEQDIEALGSWNARRANDLVRSSGWCWCARADTRVSAEPRWRTSALAWSMTCVGSRTRAQQAVQCASWSDGGGATARSASMMTFITCALESHANEIVSAWPDMFCTAKPFGWSTVGATARAPGRMVTGFDVRFVGILVEDGHSSGTCERHAGSLGDGSTVRPLARLAARAAGRGTGRREVPAPARSRRRHRVVSRQPACAHAVAAAHPGHVGRYSLQDAPCGHLWMGCITRPCRFRRCFTGRPQRGHGAGCHGVSHWFARSGAVIRSLLPARVDPLIIAHEPLTTGCRLSDCHAFTLSPAGGSLEPRRSRILSSRTFQSSSCRP